MTSLRWTTAEHAAYLRRHGQTRTTTPASPQVVAPVVDRFLELCALSGLPMPAREVLLIPGRDYRFDYVWLQPGLKVAVEQQGFRDHSTKKGLARDYEKLNLAQSLGWRVYQFTPKQLAMVETIEWLRGQLVANEQSAGVVSRVE